MILFIILITVIAIIIWNKKKSNNNTNYRKDNISLTENTKEIQNAENKTDPVKTESKISEEDEYINSFNGLKQYDMDKELTDEFMNSLISNKDVDYEEYKKVGGTTKRPDSFVVFDLETTGLSAIKNKVIEIGAIKFEFGQPIEIFHTYVNPNVKISSRITKINGISDDTVKDAPTIEEVLPKFIDFIGDNVLIAHNSPFDMSFISKNMYDLHYKKLKNKVIDTLKLSRQKIREYDSFEDKAIKLESYKLENLKDAFFLYDLPSHNAVDDCKVCAYVYLQIIEQNGDMCYLY